MNTYQIMDAKTLPLLIEKVSKYDISSLGAIAIANGHYYQSFLGALKVTEVVRKPKEILDIPAEPKAKPKRKRKVKPKEGM